MSFVMCLAPADLGVCSPSVVCSLQPLVGLDLHLKKTPVIRPKPDLLITVSLAGFWKESLCLQILQVVLMCNQN